MPRSVEPGREVGAPGRHLAQSAEYLPQPLRPGSTAGDPGEFELGAAEAPSHGSIWGASSGFGRSPAP